MERDPNEILKEQMDSIIKEKNENVEKAHQNLESNIDIPNGVDMSKINRPSVEDLKKHVGIDNSDDFNLDIDVDSGTINGTKFDNIENNSSDNSQDIDKAKAYKEKNRIMQNFIEPTKQAEDPEDPANPIINGLKSLENNTNKKIELLQQLANEDKARREAAEEEKNLKDKGIITTNDIDEIISDLGTFSEKKEYGVESDEENDLMALINKLEEQKTYANIIPNETHNGPADYDIIEDDHFSDNIADIIESNGMKVVKNGKVKKANLQKFINSGPKVTMPLINSGMFITASGAGIDEIIAMNSIQSDTPVRTELTKLNYVCDHIVNSSIGKLTLGQLLEVVSYYDKDILFYLLYAGTYPENSEFSRYCNKCGKEYYNVINTKDLLTNSDEFEDVSDYIKDNVTTMNKLLQTTKLGKRYRKIHSSGFVVFVKHPSIKSYLTTLQSITPETVRTYGNIVDMAYSIDEICNYDSNGQFVQYTNPNEIIEFISKIKNPDDKYEIYSMIEDTRPSELPVFGLKECKCPHCGFENPAEMYDMEELIFIQAQQKERMASLRWAAKNQEKQKKLKEARNARKTE